MAAQRIQRERRRAAGRRRGPDSPRRTLVFRVLTFHFIAMTWVVFRADSMDRAFEVFGRLGHWGSTEALSPLLVLAVIAGLLAQCLPQGWTSPVRETFARSGPIPQAIALGLVLLATDALGPEGVAPFIYFGF